MKLNRENTTQNRSDGAPNPIDASLTPESKITIAQEISVRVFLFNNKNNVLLQKVHIDGKPDFFITPGGRLDDPQEKLVDAVKREVKEETGFTKFLIINSEPIFSGSHVMKRNNTPVRLTEHFFVVRLDEASDTIDEEKQSLTKEEQSVFAGQQWMSLEEIGSGTHIIVPVNIYAIVAAILENSEIPEVDFNDPQEFRR